MMIFEELMTHPWAIRNTNLPSEFNHSEGRRIFDNFRKNLAIENLMKELARLSKESDESGKVIARTV